MSPPGKSILFFAWKSLGANTEGGILIVKKKKKLNKIMLLE